MKTSVSGIVTIILVLLMLVMTKPSQSVGIKDIIKKVPDDIPSLDSFLEQKPAISTSLKDAITEVPFLDDFDPKEMSLMTWLPRGSGGKFKLDRAGVFTFTSQSYCLHAGTYAPTKGDGYLYAPIAGPRAEIIKAVLERTWNRPEIEQRDIQVLIWAILAHTKVDDMNTKIRSVAYSILTKDEIMDLNGGALGMIPDEMLGKAKSKLPQAAQKVFEAEAKLRSMLSAPGTTYDELERVAVLTGTPIKGKDSREIPRGRWSFHPDGYFVRYFPSGYRTTVIQISVPGQHDIVRDSKGRIISISDNLGNKIETEYDDSIGSFSVSGDSDIKGYAFKSVRYTYRIVSHPERSMITAKEWKNTGWTFTGTPNGKGKASGSSGRFSGAGKSYDYSINHQKELNSLLENIKKAKGKGASSSYAAKMNDAMDLANYLAGIRDLKDMSSKGKNGVSPVEFIQKAWQYSVRAASGASNIKSSLRDANGLLDFERETVHLAYFPNEDRYISDVPSPVMHLAGLPQFMLGGGSDGGEGDGGGSEFDGCDNVATPGNTGSQRLKPSNREQDDSEKDKGPCDKANAALDNALQWLEAYSDPDVLENAESARDYVDDVEAYGEKKASEAAGHDVESTTDASVGSDCQLYIDGKPSTFDEFRDYLRKEYVGYPPEVIEAMVAHERKHMEQCMKDDNFGTGSDTKENVSRCEREAYCTEAQMIMDYLNSECGGVPPEAQAKFDKLCK